MELNNDNNFGKGDVFLATLVLFVQGRNVGLSLKKLKIGAGFYNGHGGGVDLKRETIAEAAIREAREETGGNNDPKDPLRGVRVREEDLRKVGVNTFVTNKNDGSKFTCIMHTFVVDRWEGEFEETDEMGMIEWFPFDALPLDLLMPADRDFMPRLLAGEKFYAKFPYNHDRTALIGEPEYRFVDSFDE